jgi:signal transduction histidine kinase
VGALAILEYGGLIPHISLGFITAPLYQNGLYIASVLLFFTTCLYISVYLATSVTINLRQKDKELLRLQQRLSSAYQRIQTLYEITKTVSSTLNLEEVLNLIAQSAAKAMQVKACTIRLLDESGQMVDTIAAYGLSEKYLTKGPIDVQKSRHIYQTLSSGQPAIISDTSRDDRLQYPTEAKTEGINSMLCVPLLIKGKAEGVICVYCTEPDHFSESDAEFLSALASEGAIAIENARTYQALEMADRAKSDFVQMVTHELRSPLSAVQSMLRLLEQGYVGPVTSKQQDLIQRSQRRISFLLSLVKDLLELAAGKVEQLRGEKHEVVLNETITKVTELMQSSAEEKGLEWKVEIAEEPLVLVGIEEGLERVFMNLVSNAVKYTLAGGLVAVRAWSENDQIKVEVSDTGIGIPEEALPRIFNEFYRAKNAKAMEMEGTGLGLAIAKDVVEQHGGQISVESTVGEGSTFYVTLPKG